MDLATTSVLSSDNPSDLQRPTEPLGMGINCRGSFFCPNIPQDFEDATILTYIYDWVHGIMLDDDIYAPGKQIACAELIYVQATYCVYAQGKNAPLPGVSTYFLFHTCPFNKTRCAA